MSSLPFLSLSSSPSLSFSHSFLHFFCIIDLNPFLFRMKKERKVRGRKGRNEGKGRRESHKSKQKCFLVANTITLTFYCWPTLSPQFLFLANTITLKNSTIFTASIKSSFLRKLFNSMRKKTLNLRLKI